MRFARLRVLALTPLLCALAACGQAATASPQPGADAADSQPPAPCPSTVHTPEPGPSYYFPNQQALNEQAGAIQDLGTSAYPAHYTGVEISNELLRVVVYRVPNADFDAAARAVPGVGCVELRDAPRPERDLRAWQDALLADHESWVARGITMHRSSPDWVRGCVVVMISDPQHDGRTLTAAYPNASLCIEKGSDEAVDLADAPGHS